MSVVFFFLIIDEFLYNLGVEKSFLTRMKNLDAINKKIGTLHCMKNIPFMAKTSV